MICRLFCTTFFSCFPLILLSATIPIRNDSSYTLSAKIFSSTGEVLGTSLLAPGQLYTWKSNYHGTSGKEKGPFRVRFFCLEGDFYGEVFPVNSGLQIYARHAIGGRKSCSPSS